MKDILYAGILIALMLLPFILIAVDYVLFIKKKESVIFEMLAFATGIVYMLFAYWIWDLPPYSHPLNLWGDANAHEPVNTTYAVTLVVLAGWGFVSYLFLKYGRKTFAPIAEVFFLAGVYIGCGICLVWCFQLVCGANPEGMSLEISDLIMILALCTVPGLFLIHAVHLMQRLIKEKAQKQESICYENVLLKTINSWLLQGANLFWVAGVLMIPILGIIIMILCLFGQQPDSAIKAFTETSDWILSRQISPPPVEYDTHYLCTVSLRGHRKLVKPIRYGIRRGEKIVVNRQLCIANAFEQLIMEKTPRFHRVVRNFYDTYGYPVSKHITTAWSADFIYLLMKPLEWIFLIVLYLFDTKPEDRIATQYLPPEALNLKNA